MYIDQRITQINVTFKLCQGLWGKGTDAGRADGRGINVFREGWEEGEWVLPGKEESLWGRAYVKVT